MGPFGGWEMPIEYTAGTVAEHTAVRTAVGIFDVSHMGKVRILGNGAYAFANSVFTNDLDRIKPGQAQYSMLCNNTGGVIDDLIVYLVSDEEVRFIPNAGNASTVVAHLEKIAPAGIVIENNHLKQGIIAVQGPSANKVVSALGLPTDHDYMAFADAKWNGFDVSICRTGYTGEPGYELVIENGGLVEIWNALLGTGAELGILPCGLGARDTLRTEMGYPLHGHELSLEITPVQASASWAVVFTKEAFRGKAALEIEKTSGPTRVLRALKSNDRGIPRAGMSVLDSLGRTIGEVTSGTFSPTLKVGIALALLSPEFKVGDEVQIDVRGRSSSASIVRAPFVESQVR
jgi:aminomethyltransferase